MNRKKIDPPIENSFEYVYNTILKQPEASTPELFTTGDVKFTAKANLTEDGRQFIDLPHSNRIYSYDWGYTTNSMGKTGQRIGQYAVPIDRWASKVNGQDSQLESTARGIPDKSHDSLEIPEQAISDVKSFEQIVDEMPLLLQKLNSQPMLKKNDIQVRKALLPQKGIYVLFEEDYPVYVGRSNNMKRRLSEHSNQGSDRYSATFAFRLAIRDYESKYGKIEKGVRRRDLEKDPEFAIIFREARSRIAEMGIKLIEIEDQITQTIFEVYAAMKLGTLEHNSFDNH